MPPQIVPERLAKQVSKKSVPKLELPTELNGNRDAFESFRRLNNVMAAYKLTQDLAELLLERGETDYEQHELHELHNGLQQNPTMNNFRTSKVPFNLAAGKVAVLLDIPQQELERRIEKEHGYSHDGYVRTVKAYNEAFAKKHPDRVRKIAGRVALDRIELRSHALAPEETSPDWILAGLESETNAVRVLDELGLRACSRPLRPDEKAALLSIYQQTFAETNSRREALRDAIAGLLVSPPFLLRYAEGPAAASFAVDDVELARRLSHFLWLSIPDAGLRELAAAGKLSDNQALVEQVDRMVADERFEDFASAFTTQWLDLSSLDNQEKLGADLRELMREEATLFIRDLFRENRSVLDLVDARYAYVNARLADHYDLPPVSGHELRRVELAHRTARRPAGHGRDARQHLHRRAYESGQSRRVDRRVAPWQTSAAASAIRARTEDRQQGPHRARGTGAAPQQSCVCWLSREDRSLRIRTRALRPRRRMARPR